MLLNFDPRQYFFDLIDEVLQPIADKYNDKFIRTELKKKTFTFFETEYISTSVTKYDIVQKREGWFRKKTNSYLVMLITGNQTRWLLKEMNKRKKLIELKEDENGILFYFKKDKIT